MMCWVVRWLGDTTMISSNFASVMLRNGLWTMHADVCVGTLLLCVQVRYQVAQPQTLLAPPVATAALTPMYGPESASSRQPRRQLPPPHGLPMSPPPNNNGSPFEQKIQISRGASSEVHPLNGGGGNDSTGGGGGGGNTGQEGSASSPASPRVDPHDGQDRKKQRQL